MDHWVMQKVMYMFTICFVWYRLHNPILNLLLNDVVIGFQVFW